MAKIDVNKVAEILKKNQLDPSLLRRVIEEMNLAVQPDPGEEEKPPPVKKQFAILLSDPEGRMPKAEFVGWVLQLPESESVASVTERICRGALARHKSRSESAALEQHLAGRQPLGQSHDDDTSKHRAQGLPPPIVRHHRKFIVLG